HLVDLREAVFVALAQALVFHAEAPVRVAVREAAVGRDLVHLDVAQHHEDHGEEVAPVGAGDLLDAFLLEAKIPGQSGIGERHLPLPRKSLMLFTIASRSRISLVTTRSSDMKCSR